LKLRHCYSCQLLVFVIVVRVYNCFLASVSTTSTKQYGVLPHSPTKTTVVSPTRNMVLHNHTTRIFVVTYNRKIIKNLIRQKLAHGRGSVRVDPVKNFPLIQFDHHANSALPFIIARGRM